MANKVGILNGVLLLILNLLAVIPIGIYFTSGVSSYSGIPLFLAQSGDSIIYTWGLVQSTDVSWWLNLGIEGITGLIVEIVLVVCCILSFIGSWIRSDGGRKLMGAILLLESIIFIYIIVDFLFIGTMGVIIPVIELFQSVGIGLYLLLLIIILQIVTVKTHRVGTY